MTKQQRAEKSARAELDRIRHAYDGWPIDEAGWRFLAEHARALVKYLDDREGAIAEAAS